MNYSKSHGKCKCIYMHDNHASNLKNNFLFFKVIHLLHKINSDNFKVSNEIVQPIHISWKYN